MENNKKLGNFDSSPSSLIDQNITVSIPEAANLKPVHDSGVAPSYPKAHFYNKFIFKLFLIVAIIVIPLAAFYVYPLALSYRNLQAEHKYFRQLKFPSNMRIRYSYNSCFFGEGYTIIDGSCDPGDSATIHYNSSLKMSAAISQINDSFKSQGLKILKQGTDIQMEYPQSSEPGVLDTSKMVKEYKPYIIFSLPKTLKDCRYLSLSPDNYFTADELPDPTYLSTIGANYLDLSCVNN